MFADLEWYWWLAIIVLLIVSVPLKIRFLGWWNRRQQAQQKEQRGKWGEDL